MSSFSRACASCHHPLPRREPPRPLPIEFLDHRGPGGRSYIPVQQRNRRPSRPALRSEGDDRCSATLESIWCGPAAGPSDDEAGSGAKPGNVSSPHLERAVRPSLHLPPITQLTVSGAHRPQSGTLPEFVARTRSWERNAVALSIPVTCAFWL